MPILKTFSNWIIHEAERIADRVPADCSLCGRPCLRFSLCQPCRESLPRAHRPCPRCALELVGHQPGNACAYCAVHNPDIDGCISLLRYRTPADRLVSGFKFQGRFTDGRTLANLLAAQIASQIPRTDLPQLLVPVPLHLSRWRTRGFNQALEIAQTLGRQCKLSTAPHLVVRTRATSAQTTVSGATARRRNLKHAFAVASPQRLRGVTHLALVDDVITTMSTVNSLAACLKSAGVARVDAWCLARAER